MLENEPVKNIRFSKEEIKYVFYFLTLGVGLGFSLIVYAHANFQTKEEAQITIELSDIVKIYGKASAASNMSDTSRRNFFSIARIR